ncbi:MAG: type II toxin-antitoxin system prevent-host-death family antitoxin [Candidatus Sumerlaeota bacterium]|nr:type II toxin-antitoxin system prevent-host-death family antitoxin [Candidatus Sumerlaeota bacterium]
MKQPQSESQAIPVTEMRCHFGAVVSRLRKRQKHAIISNSGEPVAAFLSIPEYNRLMNQERLAAFYQFSVPLGRDIEAQGVDEKALIADMRKTKRRVAEERYGQS